MKYQTLCTSAVFSNFSKSSEYPCAPPPTPRTTRSRHNNQDEDNLVHISLLLVDKNSPEYVEKYNEVGESNPCHADYFYVLHSSLF